MTIESMGRIRRFETGATRDTDDGKLDYEGFLSPTALRRFAEYMHKHRTQADGSMRNSDNWQKGIPLDAYMKSLLRHVMDVWTAHRTGDLTREELEDALCAVWFNAQGYLHELLKGASRKTAPAPASTKTAMELRMEQREQPTDIAAQVEAEREAYRAQLAAAIRRSDLALVIIPPDTGHVIPPDAQGGEL